MNKGKSKKKMNSYLKMVLIMLAGGVVGGIFGFVTSYTGENSIAAIGHGMNAFLLAVRDHTVLLECICGAICIMICEIHFGKMKRMGSQIQDAEDEEYHELQYHIEVSSSWGMIASTVGTVLMMLLISPGYSMKYIESQSDGEIWMFLAGQYAENVYWLKASGLMDQLACAVGGPILLDFSDRENPKYEKVNFSFHDYDHHLVIVNTGKGHADLSEEYSEIPMEMKEAAKAAGAELLCETTLDKVLANMDKIDNDRAILRAIHFFKENERVERAAKAVEEKDGETVLKLLSESGKSSWELLQNCYPIKAYTEQKISVALALTDLFLEKLGKGICRIHGGGFAGVIMCVVPEEETENYVSYISEFAGKENVYPMNIRAVGAVHIEK